MNIMHLDGLSIPESLMIYFGGILALIGITGIVISMAKGSSFTKYFYVIGLAIIMVGWSTIQKVTFGKDIFSIDKKVEELSKKPDDKVLYNDLANSVSELNIDKANSARSLSVLSRAFQALGHTKKGIDLADKAIVSEPGNPDAEKAQMLANVNQSINRLTQFPEDAGARQLLTRQVELLKNQPEQDSYKQQVIHDAQDILSKPVSVVPQEITGEHPIHTHINLHEVHSMIVAPVETINSAEQIEAIRSTEVPQSQEGRKYLMLSGVYRQAGNTQLEKVYLDSANAIINK